MANDWSTTYGFEDAASVCERFQLDLSCLVDGEIDEPAAARAMVHLEECPSCREFFDDTRTCVRLHRDVADPARLLARISSLTGSSLYGRASSIELVHKLATIFYQLGKAYVLAGTNPDYLRTHVFEAAVEVEPYQADGKRFVDGVIEKGESDVRDVDWSFARSMLNGRLKEIVSPLDKGRRLLEEAVASDPTHEEARLYLAFLHAHEGKKLQAAREFGEVFESAMDEANRGHAAVQLGQLYVAEGDHRRALTYFRWVSMAGLEERDERFYFVLFNIGVMYAQMRDSRRSLDYFRRLLDRHPDRVGDVARLFASARRLQQAISEQPGFGERLVSTCPELFQPAAGGESDA
ncbi:MAG: tetratricopeptide repeat protein [Phycisphaerae bacterium]|nr:tetratricopeptide repeat protein [Phycisphaerae bacterium]